MSDSRDAKEKSRKRRPFRKVRVKKKGDFTEINFNWRGGVLRAVTIIILISSGFVASFILLSIASKNANILLYTELDVDEYDEISLVVTRKGETYKLSLDLEDKESTFNIPKSSKIKEFEIKKDIVITDNISSRVLGNFSYDETTQENFSASNLMNVDGVLYSTSSYINYSYPSNNYDGVYTFTNDDSGNEPNNIDINYGFVYVEDDYLDHSKVLSKTI